MNSWEEFAKINAEYYILTEPDVDYSTTEGREYFYRSGEEFVEKTLENVKVRLHARQRALEIGCGIGRLTRPN